MGNENSQITFPIEGNNNLDKIRIKYKKIKSKEISKNNDKIISKQKNHTKQKTLKNYIVPRISTTPDRNINIPGMDKNSNNTKRYVSYEKTLKAQQNNDNKVKHKICQKIFLNIKKENFMIYELCKNGLIIIIILFSYILLSQMRLHI